MLCLLQHIHYLQLGQHCNYYRLLLPSPLEAAKQQQRFAVKFPVVWALSDGRTVGLSAEFVGLHQGSSSLRSACGQILNIRGPLSSCDSFRVAPQGSPTPLRLKLCPSGACWTRLQTSRRMSAPLRKLPNTQWCAWVGVGGREESAGGC